MKLSQYIAGLQKIQTEHGDLRMVEAWREAGCDLNYENLDQQPKVITIPKTQEKTVVVFTTEYDY